MVEQPLSAKVRMESILSSFHEFLDILYNFYTESNEKVSNKRKLNYCINRIISVVGILFQNKRVFKYVLERYYSHLQNPFTTAYHHFMNYYSNCSKLYDVIEMISRFLFMRLVYEKSSDELTTFFNN
jgi:hypothetical protein